MPDHHPSLHEDLTAEPLAAEVRDLLRDMVARGLDPAEVAEAAMITGTALSVDARGCAKTGVMLMTAGEGLLQSSGEYRAARERHTGRPVARH